MDDASVEGAIAAATYFISLYPYVYNTGDLAEWEALSHPECVFCASVSTEVKEMVSSGHRLEGAGVTISASSGAEVDPGKWFSAELIAAQAEYVEIDSSGNRLEEAPGSNLRVTFAIVREADAWRIREASPSERDV